MIFERVFLLKKNTQCGNGLGFLIYKNYSDNSLTNNKSLCLTGLTVIISSCRLSCRINLRSCSLVLCRITFYTIRLNWKNPVFSASILWCFAVLSICCNPTSKHRHRVIMQFSWNNSPVVNIVLNIKISVVNWGFCNIEIPWI